MKYRLAEEAIPYNAGTSLKLSPRSRQPVVSSRANYQHVFGFLDSIRSPRRHGAGPTSKSPAEIVEIGRAESLLMANHARGLPVYLAQRPVDAGG